MFLRIICIKKTLLLVMEEWGLIQYKRNLLKTRLLSVSFSTGQSTQLSRGQQKLLVWMICSGRSGFLSQSVSLSVQFSGSEEDTSPKGSWQERCDSRLTNRPWVSTHYSCKGVHFTFHSPKCVWQERQIGRERTKERKGFVGCGW